MVNGSGVDVDGVFGLAPVLETASIAVWVPLEDGQAVEGIKWFNNDGLAVFPRIRALAGDVDRPEILTGAVVVAENVSGANSSWSEVAFFQPLASETEGIYLVFEVPENELVETAKLVKSVMENIYNLNVPLKTDESSGKNWGELLPIEY